MLESDASPFAGFSKLKWIDRGMVTRRVGLQRGEEIDRAESIAQANFKRLFGLFLPAQVIEPHSLCRRNPRYALQWILVVLGPELWLPRVHGQQPGPKCLGQRCEYFGKRRRWHKTCLDPVHASPNASGQAI